MGSENLTTNISHDYTSNYEIIGANIKVIGVGGAGSNAVDHMVSSGIAGVDFIAINSDIQDLHHSKASKKIHIGKNITRGLGAGMNPEIGGQACEEATGEIQEAIRGANLVFVTCGLGGGTGTGAAPVIAKISKKMGILTIAVVTEPFLFEGTKRASIAECGLHNLNEVADTVMVISNDRLLAIIDKKSSVERAFALSNDILKNAIQGISELIIKPGIINLDFADVKAVMSKAGLAVMGVSISKGKDRAKNAVGKALNSPLFDISIHGAKGVLLAAAGGDDLTLYEINEAAKLITSSVDPDAKIIFGSYFDANLMPGEVKITVIATGLAGRRSKNIEISEKLEIDSEDNIKIPAFLRKKIPMPNNSDFYSTLKIERKYISQSSITFIRETESKNDPKYKFLEKLNSSLTNSPNYILQPPTSITSSYGYGFLSFAKEIFKSFL